MNREAKFPLGVVIIAVVMFFVALGTDIYWILRLFGKTFAPTLPVGPEVYKAFVYPDIVLSFLLYAGAYGLMRLKKFGFVVTYAAMGMWFSDLLLVFGLTRFDRFRFVGPCLFFILFTFGYLWKKRDLFI
jgi:hypothetical protein